ncbi:MAG: hypothetical protein CMG04_07220 [Candidatus Marinimicrobia bacterium]|nr:hypothetical protein [Candidatus Neomarinimicrobiota bacterium]
MTKTYKKFRFRIGALAIGVLFGYSILVFRLFQIQVIKSAQLKEVIVEQAQRKQVLQADRGNIFDRKNRPLTRNVIHYSLSAKPSLVEKKDQLALAISNRTGIGKDKYLKKLNSKKEFVFLERNLQRQTLGELETEIYEGFNIERNYRRYYPHEHIASQLIGYTNVDNEGISGVEKDFNKYLTGESGWVIKTRGWKGTYQKKGGSPYQDPINGNNIKLTIDVDYQSIIQEELEKRQLETDAKAAIGVIMNPQTGEILALASTPSFNNNRYYNSSINYHRIRAITDQFEPGSTFKIVAAVAALMDEKVKVSDEFDCENGVYPYYDIVVKDHEKYNHLNFSQVIKHSSNIGVIKAMELVGSNSLFKTARDLGFGTPTNISLSGELSGKLHPIKKWSRVSLGQISMGYEVGVTAIQLATAYCAIANGGYVVTPKIIDQIVNDKNEIIFRENPEIVRKIGNRNISDQIINMLRSVVSEEGGTGSKANIKGWDVAGKTGTAKKVTNGKYSNDKYISNFVGFLPASKPQLLGLVILDEPKKPFHWGSEGAAVAFNRIMKRILNLDDTIVPPKIKPKENKSIINGLDIANNVSNSIRDLVPQLSTRRNYHKKVVMPDVRGFSMRKAMISLVDNGLKYKINGSGKVSWQTPEPGKLIAAGTTCMVHLK